MTTKDSLIKDIIYKRANGEKLIGDPHAIASCKNEQSRDVIDNARLGSYDRFGNYIIIPDIKRELVSIPKLVYNVKSLDSKMVYELKATVPIFGDIFFKLTFVGEEALLTITETVYREANGYLEVYDEIVDSMFYGKNSLPKEIIFRNYNIVDKPDDFGKQSGLYDFNNILTRKVYLTLLSKELKDISKFDEKKAFDKMVSELKSSGEYGQRVLRDFVFRLKERPGVFEITKSENYNRAVNEILLSSLDIVTTQQDKEEYSTRQIYFNVLNARNENIEEYLEEANARVDDKYVKNIIDKATQNFQEENEEETVEEFFDRISDKKSVPTKRKLEKPVLKQGKEQDNKEAKSKEDKIKDIIDKKDKKQSKTTDEKKTPSGKKLKPSKSKQKNSKLKGKKKSSAKKKNAAKRKLAKKKLGKGKLKNKKKKLKKAKNPQKAKNKSGAKMGKKPSEKKPAAKKPAKKNKMLLYEQNEVKVKEVVSFVKRSTAQKADITHQKESFSHHQKGSVDLGVVKVFAKNRHVGLTQSSENQNATLTAKSATLSKGGIYSGVGEEPSQRDAVSVLERAFDIKAGRGLSGNLPLENLSVLPDNNANVQANLRQDSTVQMNSDGQAEGLFVGGVTGTSQTGDLSLGGISTNGKESTPLSSTPVSPANSNLTQDTTT